MTNNAEKCYKPLIMNAILFNTLSKHARALLPRFRCAILQFDVFKTRDIVPGMYLHEYDKTPPKWAIILNLQFLNTNKHVFVGTITYFEHSNKFVVSNAIKSYIDDLHVCGLRILASISSGHTEILEVLEQLHVKRHDDGFLTYHVGRYGPLVHMFDPSWLLRQLQKAFLTNNITFVLDGVDMVAKYEHISKTSEAKKFLTTPKTYEMLSAIKMFSCTLGCILKSVTDGDKNIAHTAEFIHIIDTLFDTFNSCDDEKISNAIRKHGPSKTHFDIWKDTIRAMETMQFEPVRIIESQWYQAKKEDHPVLLLDPKNGQIQLLKSKVGRIVKSIRSDSYQYTDNLIEELQNEMQSLHSIQLNYNEVNKLPNGKFELKGNNEVKVEEDKLNKTKNKKTGKYKNIKPYSKPYELGVMNDIDEADNELNFREKPFDRVEENKENKAEDVNDALYCDAEEDIDITLKAIHNEKLTNIETEDIERDYHSVIFDMRKKLNAINGELASFKTGKLETDQVYKLMTLVSIEIETCFRITDISLIKDFYPVLKANNETLLEIIIVIQVCGVTNNLEPRTENKLLQKFFIIMKRFTELRALMTILPSNRINVKTLTLFQMWSLSIAGIMEVLTMSRKHKVSQIFTKYFNCDTLHDKVYELQTMNGAIGTKVVQRSYSKILDDSMALFPFSVACNFTAR